jgi:hypothetical protein
LSSDASDAAVATETLATEIADAATQVEEFEVTVSYEVIRLFSDQLYPSPVKAVEELVVNGWDAGASICSVLCRLQGTDPVIAVYDNGKGMTPEELKDLWHIGVSTKLDVTASRTQIGKFGIGKLASYAVARRATYISKSAQGINSVAIDFEDFANATLADGTPRPVMLSIRRLDTIEQLLELPAFGEVLDVFRGSDKPDDALVSLIGDGLETLESWTLVVLEDLKPKAAGLGTGRLRWVLETAMPFASDFNLYLNGQKIQSSKGRLGALVHFSVKDLEEDRLMALSKTTGEQWTRTETGLACVSFPSGVTGDVYVTAKSLYAAGGKSEDLGRSHGFFVRVRNRLINETDPLFGARPLSFTTWYRFAAIVEADDLNPYVTAARDDIEQTAIKSKLRELLIALFNQARDRYQEHTKKQEENRNDETKERDREYVSPRLIEQPLADALVESHDDDDEDWEYLDELPDEAALQDFVDRLYTQPRAQRKYTFRHSAEGQFGPLVRMNPVTGVFTLNEDHEVFQEFGDKPETRRVVELLAASEALLEVYLRDAHIPEETIRYILKQRDGLLRSLARDESYSLPALARQLQDATDSDTELEIALVGALRALGFGAEHIGGSGTPDGLASYLLYGTGGKSFTLEAKSSRHVPSLGHLDFAGLNAHYDGKADGCLLVAPKYPGQDDPESQVSIRADKQHVSCWTIAQLAHVVSVAEQRQINAHQIQEIVLNRYRPLDVAAAVRRLVEEPGYSRRDLYRAIMSALRSLATRLLNTPRNISMLATEISREITFPDIDLDEIRDAVNDMARVSRGLMHLTNDDEVFVLGDLHELARRVSSLTEEAGPPRRHGTFRDVTEADDDPKGD